MQTNNQTLPITNETGQIFVGQNAGMVLHTRTSHPISFQTYSDQPLTTVTPSMKILGSGTRDVEIMAPFNIRCQQTTIHNGVIIGGSQSVEANGLYVSNNAVINRNLTVNGYLNAKPYASCLITTATNGTVTLANYGFCDLTTSSITRVGTNNKAYTITFPAVHPNGSNFVVMAVPYTSSSSSWDSTLNTDFVCTTKVENSLSMSVWCRRPGQAPAQGMIHGSFYVYTVP